MAKPRKKKSANGSIHVKRKEIEAIVNRCYQGVRILGDSHNPPRAMNVSMIWTHLFGHSHEVALETFFNTLFTAKKWSLGVICIFKNLDDSRGYEAGTATAIIEESTGYEVSNMMGDVINEVIQCIQDSDPTFTNDRFVKWGYFIEPEVSERINLRLKGLTDLFMNIDDIEKYEPFNDNIPKLETDSSTIPMACKNHSVFKKLKTINYYCIDESTCEGVDEQL